AGHERAGCRHRHDAQGRDDRPQGARERRRRRSPLLRGLTGGTRKMSRVGKMPVAVPQGVDVQIKEDQISVKGTGGTLSLAQNALVKVVSKDGKLSFEPANDSREA